MTDDDKDKRIAELEADLDSAEGDLELRHETLWDMENDLHKAERVRDHLHERLETVAEAASVVLVKAERLIERQRISGPYLDEWDEATARLRAALVKDADTTPAGISWRNSEERMANIALAFGLPEKTPDSEIMQVAAELLLAADENNRVTHKIGLAYEDALDRLAKLKAAALRYLDDVTLGEGEDALGEAIAELESREDELRALCAEGPEVEA